MKNILVISALVLASSIASAVTVRGSGRLYANNTTIKTVKDACSAATQSAEKSLNEKCSLLGGQVSSDVKLTVDPVATSYESFCTAYAEANCQ
ncbi:MAG: hypothetical protein NDI63_14465 [Pseudobdellovibrio sp.]|nr:hypothetical protein [Pseudobdellovibrio sp.]